MGNIRQIVLDVLKPHRQDLIQYSDRTSSIRDIKGASIFLNKVDQETKNVKIIIEGERLNYQLIKGEIEEMVGSVHSVDAVYADEEIVDEIDTPQDR